MIVYHYNGGVRWDHLTAADSKISSNNILVERIKQKDPFLKRIIVVDDDPDITLTFKAGLEEYYDDNNDNNDNNNKTRFEVHTYNDPLLALSQFKPHFYDLLLTDINMLHMNGFELCEKILELDVNIRVCFYYNYVLLNTITTVKYFIYLLL
jgi:CheY-like chemotaxis protein